MEPHFDEGLAHAGFCCSVNSFIIRDGWMKKATAPATERSHITITSLPHCTETKNNHFNIPTRGLSEYLWTDCDWLSRCICISVIQYNMQWYKTSETKIFQHVLSLLTGAWCPVHLHRTAVQPQRPQGWIASHIWRMRRWFKFVASYMLRVCSCPLLEVWAIVLVMLAWTNNTKNNYNPTSRFD